ncbi:signal peptidase II [Brevundimonas sp.]|jgi:signal peptidase II|uniref:signal peptidase II n=1 Tax=Brevundimonas sp. TaxID=1871086 RepID=UPI002E0F74BC|nr:signal peptidase II [Brevundimonas sp.]
MKIPRIAWAAYGFALLIIVLDQATKAWVLGSADVSDVAMIPDGYRFAQIIPGVFNITMVRNTGVSFGLFGGGEARWALTVFSLLVSAFLVWWATRTDRRILISAIGLVIGGAVGNAIDRIQYGYVVDFLDFSDTGLFPWVFNVADAAITVGVALLFIDGFLSDRRPAQVGVAPEKS